MKLPTAGRFRAVFDRDPVVIVSAPGRVNLMGDHTDYNGGLVLPMTIDRHVVVAAAVGEPGGVCRIHSERTSDTISFRWEDVDAVTVASHGWSAYPAAVLGVLARRYGRGSLPWSLMVSCGGDLPVASGLSSSSALCVALTYAVLRLAGIAADGREVALLAQAAEHSPQVGLMCGIMDQMVVALGREGCALLIDCATLATRDVPMNCKGADIVLLDTGTPRTLATSEYNVRRGQCGEALQWLRQATGETFSSLAAVPESVVAGVRNSMPPTLWKRARHVVSESARVLSAADALERGDAVRVGQLMYDSHQSLRDDYEVSCPELDAVVTVCESDDAVLGCRMTGAGFGGCAVALVHAVATQGFAGKLGKQFYSQFGREPNCLVVHATSGVEVAILSAGVSK